MCQDGPENFPTYFMNTHIVSNVELAKASWLHVMWEALGDMLSSLVFYLFTGGCGVYSHLFIESFRDFFDVLPDWHSNQ